MPELGVNIDHVATLRQARRTYEPDPVWAAALAELGGADGITIHLREDRRHIQDRDLELLRKTVTVKLNLELACESQVLDIACRVKPDQATLVPERREEVTTEGGLDVVGNRDAVAPRVAALKDAGIFVSLFVDPDERQIEASRDLAADAVELHTGRYALAAKRAEQGRELIALVQAGALIRATGNGAARRARAELSERLAGGDDRRHARTEYRACDCVAGGDGGHGARSARDESGSWVIAVIAGQPLVKPLPIRQSGNHAAKFNV